MCAQLTDEDRQQSLCCGICSGRLCKVINLSPTFHGLNSYLSMPKIECDYCPENSRCVGNVEPCQCTQAYEEFVSNGVLTCVGKLFLQFCIMQTYMYRAVANDVTCIT